MCVCGVPLTEAAQCAEGEVRVVGGSVGSEGRVEMCQWGRWTSVCADDNWNTAVAKVVCSQLGYEGKHYCFNSGAMLLVF